TGHLEELVQARLERCDLGLQLSDAVTVAHVLAEVVKAVPPVVQGAGREDDHERHDRHGPERDSPQMDDRETDVDGAGVAVAEDGRRDAQRQAENERGCEHETLPEVAQIGHPANVTPLPGGWSCLNLPWPGRPAPARPRGSCETSSSGSPRNPG